MDKKNLMLPLLIAVAAAVIYWLVLTSREKELTQGMEMGKVLIAKLDIPPRTVIKEDLVDIAEVPRRYMQHGVREIKTQSDIKLISNLVSAVRISKGNQITDSALLSLSPEAGLSVKVPLGQRGITLPVDNDLIKLVKPGDRVDLLVTFDAAMADGRKEKVTVTLLQNVLVLGVGQNLGQGMASGQATSQAKAQAESFSDKGSLSLAMNPVETQYLALGQKQGEITPTVRALGDWELHPIEMASFRKLFK